MDLSRLMAHLNDSLVAENGPGLAYLLRPTSPHGKELVKEFRNPTKASLRRYEGGMVKPWDEISIQYVLVCAHIAKKQYQDAFKEHAQLVSLFFKFFNENSGWTLPALFSMLRDQRDLAADADTHAAYNNERGDCMELAARTMAKAFTNCMVDRQSPPEESRKWGVYYVVGLVLKSYFRLKTISLAKPVLRALDADPNIPPLIAFPRSHQVTYRYYIGMLSFLNEDYTKAEQELTLAFYHCHNDALNNKERILAFLIPLRILRGHLPSAELLARFPVLKDLFSPFIDAIRSGDLIAYDRALEMSERRLVDLSLWLVVEKARELALRGLFRKVWVVSDKSSRIPISMFHASLKVSGMDVPADEAECLVANMIAKGFIRGYISHEKQMVVLAQTNAFPRAADRPAPFAMF